MRQNLRLPLLFIAAWLLGSLAAAAQIVPGGARPIRAVVELFTSQGCSSCPDADALLKTYAESGDIMALTFPVDYWDYIGWRDTFASPANSDRQRAYAKTFDLGPVYTPQVVVNGTAQALGSSREQIDSAISETAPVFASHRVPVHFWNEGNMIVIETGDAPPGMEGKTATIWLAVVQKQATVNVKAGENSGKALSYTNVVRQMAPVGLWNGEPSTIRLARAAIMHPDTEDIIVLIQEADNGPIIGAAWLGH